MSSELGHTWVAEPRRAEQRFHRVCSTGSVGTDSTATITYHYNSVTARLDSMVGTTGAGAMGRVRWQYDRGGRDTLMGVALAGVDTPASRVDLRTS